MTPLWRHGTAEGVEIALTAGATVKVAKKKERDETTGDAGATALITMKGGRTMAQGNWEEDLGEEGTLRLKKSLLKRAREGKHGCHDIIAVDLGSHDQLGMGGGEVDLREPLSKRAKRKAGRYHGDR